MSRPADLIALSLLLLLLAPSVAAARPRSSLHEALEAAQEASQDVQDTEGRCAKKAGRRIERLLDALEGLREEPSAPAFRRALEATERAREEAEDCPRRVARRVGESLDRVSRKLRHAREAFEERRETTREAVREAPPTASVRGPGFGLDFRLGGVTVPPPHRAPPPPRVVVQGAKPFAAACRSHDECQSGLCTSHDRVGYCTRGCTNFTECPTFWHCRSTAGITQQVCLQK